MNQIFKAALRGLILTFCCLLPGLTSSRAQVMISEFMASNTATMIDPEHGVFSDWIELVNTGTAPVSLSGYWMSDDPAEPQKWALPDGQLMAPGACLLLWADQRAGQLHASFALSRDGESLILTREDGSTADRVDYGTQFSGISYGRGDEGYGEWMYFGRPTPGEANSYPGLVRPVFAPVPLFSTSGGYRQGAFDLILSLPYDIPGAQILFSCDGSEPVYGDESCTGIIPVNHSMVVRARVVAPGLLPSPVITESYLFDAWRSLPVFSLAIDPDHLWNDRYGIYVDGSGFNGERESRNSCQADWERPGNISFFEVDGSLQFSEQVGIEVKGRMNCEFPKKPLGVFFKSKYGESVLNYRLFQDKTVTRFSSFILRPGGADGMGNCYNGTMFRDGLLSTLLAGGMDIDYEAYRPAVLYINGQYWGIHNIRERNKADYLAGNMGIDPNEVDILENIQNGGVIEGDNLHYQSLMNLIMHEDVNHPDVYEQIKSKMDVDEFINYQIAEIFVNNEDWAANNVLCWRPRTPEGRWRWVFFDVEGGFGLYDSDDYRNNLFGFKDDDFLRHRNLFYGLMRNSGFKAEFIQRFAGYLNTLFLPERVIGVIDSLRALIADEMPADVELWGDSITQGGSGCRPIASIQEWEDHVEIMREFARRRPAVIRD